MNCDLLIRNGTIVTPEKTFQGYIAVDAGKITAMGSGDTSISTANQIDAHGRYVLPGVIDPTCTPGLYGYAGSR